MGTLTRRPWRAAHRGNERKLPPTLLLPELQIPPVLGALQPQLLPASPSNLSFLHRLPSAPHGDPVSFKTISTSSNRHPPKRRALPCAMEVPSFLLDRNQPGKKEERGWAQAVKLWVTRVTWKGHPPPQPRACFLPGNW